MEKGIGSGKVAKLELAESGEYRGMYRIKYYYPVISIIKEEKLKGENLLGIQFCANSNELMAQGVNTYINKEYYCVKIDK